MGSRDYNQAEPLGSKLAKRGYVVCSGGYDGVMEAVLKGAASEGGKCAGVLTRYFNFMDLKPNPWVQACVVAEELVDRMKGLYEVGDGFIGLPGSTGTLAEIAATLELINKARSVAKPLICLGNYWKPILDVIGEQARPFEPDQKVRSLIHFAGGADDIVDRLAENLG